MRDAPFYVLLGGRAGRVRRPQAGQDVHVAAADAGTYIGDIAFAGEPTITAAVATEETMTPAGASRAGAAVRGASRAPRRRPWQVVATVETPGT